jgi:serine/threonine protein kinase
MQKLKKPVDFETTFGTYTATEIIGQGGAGRVFAASDDEGNPVAVKLLNAETASKDKRRRFKNEIAFLQRTTHRNLVPVLDHGVSTVSGVAGPFYVMPRYDGSLRELLNEGIAPQNAIKLFGQLLNGVEAAHLVGAVHRDLKPENVLFSESAGAAVSLAIADFGIARMQPDIQETLVETSLATRLANFVYAAPEQRQAGVQSGVPADIFALGLILNEIFTGVVPHGSDFRRIGDVHSEFAYLDAVVDAMTRQSPDARLVSVEEVKRRLRVDHEEAMLKQRLSTELNAVVLDSEVDDRLVTQPVRIVDFDWDNGQLTLTLSQHVTHEWADLFRSLGDYSAVMGADPSRFVIEGNKATVAVRATSAQDVINYVKQWLPKVTSNYRESILRARRNAAEREMAELRRQRERDEERLRVMSNLRI